MKFYFVLGATIIIASLLLLFNFTGCGHPIQQFSGDLPTVTAVSPADNGTDIETNITLTASFSQAMDPASISPSTFTLSSSEGSITGAVSYDAANKTAFFTPSAHLSEGLTFTAVLSSKIKNSSGDEMGTMYSWHFTTASSITVTGTPDSTFGTKGVVAYYIDSPITFSDGSDLGTDRTSGIAFSGGKILLTGTRYDFAIGHSMSIWRFNSNGKLDTSFGSNGEVNYAPTLSSSLPHILSGSMDLDSLGRILIAGESTFSFGVLSSSSEADLMLWRFDNNGSADNSFGITGLVELPTIINYSQVIAVEDFGAAKVRFNPPDNCIYVMEKLIGKTSFWKFGPTGAADTGFGNQGTVSFNTPTGESFVLDSASNIYAAGSRGKDLVVWSFNSQGTLNPSFGNVSSASYPNARARSITLAPSGNLLVAGQAGDYPAVWKFSSNGQLDTSFGSGGIYTYSKTNGSAKAVLSDAGGKIYVTGYTIYGGNQCAMFLLRLNPDGTPDTGFGNQGVIDSDLSSVASPGMYRRVFGNGLAFDSSGRVLVCGDFNGSMIIWRFK